MFQFVNIFFIFELFKHLIGVLLSNFYLTENGTKFYKNRVVSLILKQTQQKICVETRETKQINLLYVLYFIFYYFKLTINLTFFYFIILNVLRNLKISRVNELLKKLY